MLIQAEEPPHQMEARLCNQTAHYVAYLRSTH